MQDLTTMNNKIISCAIHDHFEIACMRASKITLELHNGQRLDGIAKDLETKNKNELLHLQITTEQQAETIKINLLDIKTLNIAGNDTTIAVSSSSCSV